MTKKDNQSIKSLEDNLLKLEGIVKNLESGELPLHDAMKKYQSGIEVIKTCEQAINTAKQQILVVSDDENFSTTKFGSVDEDK